MRSVCRAILFGNIGLLTLLLCFRVFAAGEPLCAFCSVNRSRINGVKQECYLDWYGSFGLIFPQLPFCFCTAERGVVYVSYFSKFADLRL